MYISFVTLLSFINTMFRGLIVLFYIFYIAVINPFVLSYILE